jgi:hypothetical protein
MRHTMTMRLPLRGWAALQKEYEMNIDKELTQKMYDSWLGGSPYRSHLGASVIGQECDRAIYYSWRWSDDPRFDGRMLRLFERGRREEEMVIHDLIGAGLEIEAEKDGKHINFSDVDGHFRGSVDGVGKDAKGYFLLEIKTHGTKSFDELIKIGVEESKKQHYCQMQVYMGELKLKRGLYVAVCKNDDRLHVEWIDFVPEAYTALRQRAREIIYATEPPEKLSENPAHYKCKMCNYHGICHGGQVKAKNCRTCRHSEPREDGTWHCNLHDKTLSWGDQVDACNKHEYDVELPF